MLQLPNDTIFIWFTDKNPFTLTILKNSHNNRLYAPAATKKKNVGVLSFLFLQKNDVQSVAAVGVSKLDYTGLTLVDPRVKTNEIYDCGSFSKILYY